MLPTTNIEVDVVTLSFIAGTVIPLLVALLTKSSASGNVKAFVNLILTGAAGGVAVLIAGDGSAPWQEVAAAFGAAFLVSGSTYSHLWKPAGIAGGVANATRNVGVG